MYENLKDLGSYNSLISLQTLIIDLNALFPLDFILLLVHLFIRICRQVTKNDIYLYHNFALS